MAELLVVAGGIASFTSIAKLTSHLVQGCLSLRQLIKDAKNAPENVRKLIAELETLSHTADGMQTIAQNTHNDEMKAKIGEAVRQPLQQCVTVVDDLKAVLYRYENRMGKTGSTAWWEKVKAVKGKKGISRSLEDIERAKSGLILAYQNASSITMQSQGDLLGTMNEQNLATSAKIDNSLNQGIELLNFARATEEQMRQTELRRGEDSGDSTTRLKRMSESQCQYLNQTSQSFNAVHNRTIDISTQLGAISDQGQMVLTVTSKTNQSVTENHETLQAMQHNIEQMATRNEPQALVGVLLQALDARDRMKAHSRATDANSAATPPHKFNVEPHSSIPPGSIPNLRASKRRRKVAYTQIASNRFVSIESTTWEQIPEPKSSEGAFAEAKTTETCLTLRLTLPFFKRALYYTCTKANWDPFSERKIRPVLVFSTGSAIEKACKRFDVDAVRQLFISGEASPFMENQYGESLLDLVVMGVTNWCNGPGQHTRKEDVEQFFDFLLNACGRGAIHFHPCGIKTLILSRLPNKPMPNMPWGPRVELGKIILRDVLKRSINDPLVDHFIPTMVDLDTTQNPLLETITQQNIWPLNLSPSLTDRGTVVENGRQMLDDPLGVELRELLQGAKAYNVHLLISKFSYLPYEYLSSAPISSLLQLSFKSRESTLECCKDRANFWNVDRKCCKLRAKLLKVQECCKNRIKLLISTPEFHRFMQSETSDFNEFSANLLADACSDYYKRLSRRNTTYIGRYAIRNGFRNDLEEALHEMEWSQFDIDDFFDKETFYKVPELLDGQIVYETSEETFEGFITRLCTGAYSSLLCFEISALAFQLCCLIGSNTHYDVIDVLVLTIKAANTAFVSRTTPGSWPNEGGKWLVPGIDFEVGKLPGYIRPPGRDWDQLVFSWYHDYIDPNFRLEIEDSKGSDEDAEAADSNEDSDEDSVL